MQQLQGRPASREGRIEDRRQYVSADRDSIERNGRLSGEPAKFNTRSSQQRINWENDLYERQSM